MPGRHYRPEAARAERRNRIALRCTAATAALAAVAAIAVGTLGGGTPARAVADEHVAQGAVGRTSSSLVTAPPAAPSSQATTSLASTPLLPSASATLSPSPPGASTVNRELAAHVPDAVDAATNIPLVALTAYKNAATWSRKHQSSCRMSWPYLAAFGRIESDHGRVNGSALLANGVATPAIYGPAIASITDAHGKPVRAAGPLQFIPSTWAKWGHGSPQNINAAALAAARYLCASPRDMSTAKGRHDGAFSYNHVQWYATDIEALYQAYLHHHELSSYPASPPKPKPTTSKTPTPKPNPTKRPTSPPTSKAPTRSPSPSPTRPVPSKTSPKPSPTPTPKSSPSSSTPSS